MKFHYVAAAWNGKIVEDTLEAKSQDEVLSFLATKGLRPISVKTSNFLQAFGGNKSIFAKKINLTDKMFLTRYLALMLRVNTDLFRAIDILIADFRKPALKAILQEVRANLERGQPFYTTFEKYPQFFSAVFTNMIKAGESSGMLEKVLNDLSISLEKEKALKGKVKAALIYPIILIVLSVVIVTFLLTFALPKIAGIFEGSSIKPPLFSRIVFAIGLFLGNYIWIILIAAVIIVGGLALFFTKSVAGRRLLHKILYRTPFIKTLLQKIAIQRFTSVFGSLLRAGLPVNESLETTADAVTQEEVSEALHRIGRQGIAKGVSLGESFRKETVFPSVVTNLIAISEKGGRLDEILKTLSDFYEVEIDASLKTLIAFVEPIMLMIMGLVVGMIALSLIVPIYQLVGQF